MDDRARAILRTIAAACRVPIGDMLRPGASPIRSAAARILRIDGFTWPEVAEALGATGPQAVNLLHREPAGRVYGLALEAYCLEMPPRVEEVPVVDWPQAVAISSPGPEVVAKVGA